MPMSPHRGIPENNSLQELDALLQTLFRQHEAVFVFHAQCAVVTDQA